MMWPSALYCTCIGGSQEDPLYIYYVSHALARFCVVMRITHVCVGAHQQVVAGQAGLLSPDAAVAQRARVDVGAQVRRSCMRALISVTAFSVISNYSRVDVGAQVARKFEAADRGNPFRKAEFRSRIKQVAIFTPFTGEERRRVATLALSGRCLPSLLRCCVVGGSQYRVHHRDVFCYHALARLCGD